MHHLKENKPEEVRYRLVKKERLNSRKVIEKLFAEGESFLVYPVKVIYFKIAPDDAHPAKVAFAVSKKLYKKAVHRNLIKRRMREAYRLNKQVLSKQESKTTFAVVFIYIAKQVVEYKAIEKAMIRSLGKLNNLF
jgi:ribonuclease P protein component